MAFFEVTCIKEHVEVVWVEADSASEAEDIACEEVTFENSPDYMYSAMPCTEQEFKDMNED